MTDSKLCACCKQSKPLSDFYPDSRKKDGLSGHCKVCHLEKCKRYYSNLPAERKEEIYRRQQELIATIPEAADRKRARYRKWLRNNPDKAKECDRKYSQTHREKRNEKDRRRKANKLMAPGNGISAQQEINLRNEYCNLCVYCGKKFENLEVDHIEPISKGGAHDITNAAPACKSCNSSKGNKTLLMFLVHKASCYTG